MTYIEHFNEQSPDYLQYRPDYPHTLFAFLASLVKEHDTAWDVGTGNGQAAVLLADYFRNVVGTDVSQEQLKIAKKKSNVRYHRAPAERSELSEQSVDLITIAQALHWFDLERFYEEVRRVAKPEAVIAAWSYGLGSINAEIDVFIKELYTDILGNQYWPKERHYIDEHYRTISFPFTKILPPQITLEKMISFDQLIGYLNTWSAVKEYQKRNQRNPLELIQPKLMNAWGEIKQPLNMQWPLYLLAGKVME